MKQHWKTLLFSVLVLGLVLFLTTFRLPYYIYQPGSASALDPFIEVEGGYDSEGDMHLVTVRGGQATPIYFLWAKLMPFYHIYDIDDIRPKGISQEEYNHIQLQSMNSSQEKAIMVAYDAANKEYSFEYLGVYVLDVTEGMPAYNVIKSGDKIVSIDGNPILKSDDLLEYIAKKEQSDLLSIEVEREGELETVEVSLAPFPDEPERIGLGITLVTDRQIVTDPEITINSGDIGGPSAGLMFTLEIYDQLTEEDYTKGYQICGTGTISEDGTVGPIGGIDQKVVASDDEGCDVFFAPNEQNKPNSDYQIAKETAEEIETDMEIVPVDTFEDALQYLENLTPKAS